MCKGVKYIIPTYKYQDINSFITNYYLNNNISQSGKDWSALKKDTSTNLKLYAATKALDLHKQLVTPLLGCQAVHVEDLVNSLVLSYFKDNKELWTEPNISMIAVGTSDVNRSLRSEIIRLIIYHDTINKIEIVNGVPKITTNGPAKLLSNYDFSVLMTTLNVLNALPIPNTSMASGMTLQ